MKRISFLLVLILSVINCFGQTPYGDYRVLVDVTGNGFSHNTQVYFDDESWDPQNPPSYSWDPCCDAQLILGASDRPHVFTQVVEPPAPAPNYRLSLNGLPHLFEQTDVPLGFLPGTLAQYTFSFTHLYTLPAGVSLELEDVSLNVTQDLLIDSSYVTWGAPSDDEERFILHFYPSNVTGINNEKVNRVVLRNIGSKIVANGPSGVSEATCFDMLGSLVSKKTNVEASYGDLSLEMQGQAAGIYVVVIKDLNGKLTHHKVLYK